MSVLELAISTSPEALLRAIGGVSGAFWIDGRVAGAPTFTSFAPVAQLVLDARGVVHVRDEHGARIEHGDALDALESFVAAATPFTDGDAPRTVGFFAYDLIGCIEARVRPRRASDDALPLARLARYDAVLEVPRQPSTATSAQSLRVHAIDDAAARRVAAQLERVLARVAASSHHDERRARIVEGPALARHVAAVRRALAYVAAGDVYQVNLAQRLRIHSDAAPVDVFQRMLDAQPVPFGVFLECDGFAVLCCSPERFLRVRGARIETEPIKGTRPRGATPFEDDALRAALRADAKERAEHVMIVDLERNDLGRVCDTGSVTVPSLLRVESFATLHHMVSSVQGRLRDDVGLAALLRATFPGGSITGAPKIRAAQVIAELEPAPREIYTGAVAWFRDARDFDSAIAIRTAVTRDGVYTYHAGGGIVADSDPEREHRECVLKAQPFLRALGVDAADCDAYDGDTGVAPAVDPHDGRDG